MQIDIVNVITSKPHEFEQIVRNKINERFPTIEMEVTFLDEAGVSIVLEKPIPVREMEHVLFEIEDANHFIESLVYKAYKWEKSCGSVNITITDA